jgi:uncharacterized cupredoxin-like copper-binding protein
MIASARARTLAMPAIDAGTSRATRKSPEPPRRGRLTSREWRLLMRKMNTLLAVAGAAVPLAFATAAFAAGDLSRADPQEIVLEMGTSGGGKMFFKPNHLELETGKAYKLVLRNPDKVKHELEGNEFIDRIFTRKVEVAKDGHMIAEIKGAIREVEVGPGSDVEWFIVPVQTGKELELECALPGHKEAGMHGTVTIK